jgi:hypothetical protein
MKYILCSVAFVVAAVSLHAAPPVKLSDQQLRAEIVGVWFGEELPEITRHIAQRTQYYPDGRFVSDFRISGPDTEHYIRSVGTWQVVGGQFSETTQQTSDPAIKFPTLTRHVVAIDRHHMILETSDGTRAEYWLGNGQLERVNRSVSSVDRKRLLADLAAMHVSGYHSVPAGDGSHSFQLDSRKIRSPH